MADEKRPNEYEEANDRITEMNSLSECIAFLAKKGYTEQFKVEGNMLLSTVDDKPYAVEEVTAMNFYRFEGLTSPDDMEVLYAIETSDGRKGTLVDAYGTYSDSDIDEFVKEMEIHKKVSKK